MQVDTTRFGPIEVAEEDLVAFADGLPGFEGARRMVLIGAGDLEGADGGESYQNLYWLQDVDTPELAFLTLVPWSAYPDYDIELDPDEFDEAGPDDICVLNIITVRRENGGMQMTANLMAPVVIDTARRFGRQVILDDPALDIQAPLAQSNDDTGGVIQAGV